jgi:hypothetical protein
VDRFHARSLVLAPRGCVSGPARAARALTQHPRSNISDTFPPSGVRFGFKTASLFRIGVTSARGYTNAGTGGTGPDRPRCSLSLIGTVWLRVVEAESGVRARSNAMGRSDYVTREGHRYDKQLVHLVEKWVKEDKKSTLDKADASALWDCAKDGDKISERERETLRCATAGLPA